MIRNVAMDELTTGWARQIRLNGEDIAQQVVFLCMERLRRGPLHNIGGWMARVGWRLHAAEYNDAVRYTGWRADHRERDQRVRVPLSDARAATLRAESDPAAEGYARHVLRQLDPRLVEAAAQGSQDGSLAALPGFSYSSITIYRKIAMALTKDGAARKAPPS